MFNTAKPFCSLLKPGGKSFVKNRVFGKYRFWKLDKVERLIILGSLNAALMVTSVNVHDPMKNVPDRMLLFLFKKTLN